MTDKVKPIPDGFHTITPHLTVRDAKRAIEFYQKAFGAEVLSVAPGPGDKVMHASLKIGDSILMLNDEFPEFGGQLGPSATTGSPVALHIYLDDVDSCIPARRFRGRHCKNASDGSVLGRPLWCCDRSFRTQVVAGHSHPRYVSGGNGAGAREGIRQYA